MKNLRKNLRGTVRSGRSSQQGVVMYVALVVLIVMTLAGLAMMRQMTAGVSIAGNLAFKQNATSVADQGIETGRAWIQANVALLATTQPANVGYYSNWGGGQGIVGPAQLGSDPQAADWDASWAAVPDSPDIVGNSVRYIIHRLCLLPNLPVTDPAQRCSDAGGINSGDSKSGTSYGSGGFAPVPQPYYRITARVTGPRNTVSYTQIVLR